MGRHNHHSGPWNSHPKRRQNIDDEHADDDDQCVDDLAIAAQYAVVPLPYYSTTTTSTDRTTTSPAADDDPSNTSLHAKETAVEDSNEIDLDDDDTDPALEQSPLNLAHHDDIVDDRNIGSTNSSSSSSAAGSPEHMGDDDDDDDDDDVDLKEQLARMVAAGDEDDLDDECDGTRGERKCSKKQQDNNSKPMTAHEIDLYAADLHALPKEFQWNVALVPEERSTPDLPGPPTPAPLDTTTTPSLQQQQQQWGMAGTLQHHMVSSRTVTVLSLGGLQILPEGTWLAVRSASDDNDNTTMIRLGRILEVFGPVSQPLYSVRLPDPPATNTTTTILKSPTGKTGTMKPPNQEVLVEHIIVEQDADQPQPMDPTTASNTESPNTLEATEMADRTNGTESEECLITAALLLTVEKADSSAETTPAEATTDWKESAPTAVENNKLEETTALPTTASTTTTTTSTTTTTILDDPWSADGEYTKLLQKSPRVYFELPHSGAAATTRVFLDTQAIYRESVGRGCDASNFYDEEAQDIDFSDDEQERLAKGQRKKSKSRGRGGAEPPLARGPPPPVHGGGVPPSFHRPAPLGFHSSQTSHQQYSHTSPPQHYFAPPQQQRESGAFYHGNNNNNTTPYYPGPHPQYQTQSQYQGQSYAAYPSGGPYRVPPPPPQGYSQYPPQPPPPQQPESESDTVYYDFT